MMMIPSGAAVIEALGCVTLNGDFALFPQSIIRSRIPRTFSAAAGPGRPHCRTLLSSVRPWYLRLCACGAVASVVLRRTSENDGNFHGTNGAALRVPQPNWGYGDNPQ